MCIEKYSEPQNLRIYCKKCKKRMPVGFKDLRENNPVTCPRCEVAFTPDIDIEALIKLMKQVEDTTLDSDLIM